MEDCSCGRKAKHLHVGKGRVYFLPGEGGEVYIEQGGILNTPAWFLKSYRGDTVEFIILKDEVREEKP